MELLTARITLKTNTGTKEDKRWRYDETTCQQLGLKLAQRDKDDEKVVTEYGQAAGMTRDDVLSQVDTLCDLITDKGFIEIVNAGLDLKARADFGRGDQPLDPATEKMIREVKDYCKAHPGLESVPMTFDSAKGKLRAAMYLKFHRAAVGSKQETEAILAE